ncbi:MAG: hypothetical protein EB078_05805 [Proteobacteria bacterium]|nr:hypothetical protein [Pseudomonadota bacterium]NDC24430.1 hypothetical protein [Pseudomonadota bacterium]NDD04400.1 hypothetical protein [Pseudomonadota bacterium]NDG26882.1 hypothetical protein [Pseudomonadota bacterium]
MLKHLIIYVIALVSVVAYSDGPITQEERKRLLDQPDRGLFNQGASSTGTTGFSPSNTFGTPSNGSSNQSQSPFSFTEINNNFQKNISSLTEQFNKSLPTVTEDSSALKDFTSASNRLNDSESGADSFSSQIVDSIIVSLNQLAQLQIIYDKQALLRNLEASQTAQQAQQEKNKVVQNISSKIKLRGLSSPALDALTTKAYNPPR